MTQWPSAKARRVFNALLALGWQLKRQSGSHRTLSREGWPNLVFAFHEGEELVRACSLASPSTLAFDQKTCSVRTAAWPDPSVERTSQRLLRTLCAAAHVER